MQEERRGGKVSPNAGIWLSTCRGQLDGFQTVDIVPLAVHLGYVDTVYGILCSSSYDSHVLMRSVFKISVDTDCFTLFHHRKLTFGATSL